MIKNERAVLILDPLPADVDQEIDRRFRVLRAYDGDLRQHVARILSKQISRLR